MAEVETDVATGQPKRRTFRKFAFRGVDLDQLLDMSTDELVKLFTARARRRFQRGLKRKPMALIKKLRKAKKEAPQGEKPEPVRTHLRNMIIVPEMIGSIIGVYNGKTFNQVEIKPEMIGHYLAEFSISYKPVKHGRPGIGATHSSSGRRATGGGWTDGRQAGDDRRVQRQTDGSGMSPGQRVAGRRVDDEPSAAARTTEPGQARWAGNAQAGDG
ncbi:uncharacterized protein A4U43_C03F5870 [Asparagus officinalis]|uniref:40S ribosomal protein S15 n=2 Tax=Asparagus officinalis TaxID=4686 RepID=A0A5P1F8E6_ASPOF|nr:uncharacterized protein A4U43_C03F5870 [Asparagus officinalis]